MRTLLFLAALASVSLLACSSPSTELSDENQTSADTGGRPAASGRDDTGTVEGDDSDSETAPDDAAMSGDAEWHR